MLFLDSHLPFEELCILELCLMQCEKTPSWCALLKGSEWKSLFPLPPCLPSRFGFVFRIHCQRSFMGRCLCQHFLVWCKGRFFFFIHSYPFKASHCIVSASPRKWICLCMSYGHTSHEIQGARRARSPSSWHKTELQTN